MWSYQLDTIIPTCREFEDKLIKLVWKSRPTNVSIASMSDLLASNGNSNAHLNEEPKEKETTKEAVANPAEVAAKRATKPAKKRFWGLAYFVTDKDDVEKTAEGPSPRPIRLFAPVYNGLGVAMSICASYTSLSLQWLNPAV